MIQTNKGLKDLTYLLELLHIDVELCAEFGFRLGKSRHLAGQLVRLGRFGLLLFALLFEPCSVVLYFKFLESKHGVVL
jgi:hypothetical protein